MKNLLLIFLLVALKVSAQTPFPLFVPTNPDSIKTVVNVNGAPRTVYNIDLVRYRAALTAKDTAAALRLLIAGNTSAIATNTSNISANTTAIGLKADKSNTISINGTSQTLGSNPSFTVSGGGGSPDTVNYIATKTDLKGKILGTLYNKNSWTSASDFTQVGSNTLAFTGNKINVSGASKAISATLNTSNTTLPTVLRITSYGGTMLEKYKFVAKIKVNQAPSATSYGFSTGTYSTNSTSVSNAMGYFNMSTATGTGTVSILAGVTNATAAISPNALTFSQNDYILLTTERTADKLTVTAQNLTAGGEVSASYAWDATATTNFLLPNTSNFAIGNMGGSYIVDSIGISSSETKGANLLLVGDSKFAGYATPWDGRVGSILDKSFIAGTITSAGQADKTADVLAHLPEIISLSPKQVLLCIGRNDISGGVASATWQANLNSIVSQLQSAGISVILLDAIYETSVNQAALVSYIQTTYPNAYISSFSATTSSTYVADAIHQNFAGTKTLADVIYNSPLIADYGKYPNAKPQNSSQNYISNNHYFNGTIYDLGRTYTPDVINGGDIVLRHGSGLTAAAGIASQKSRIEMGSGITFRSYTGSSGGTIFFYVAGATTGTQTTGLQITNTPRILSGSASPGANSVAGDVIVPSGSAFASSLNATVGQEARIVPRSATSAMELRTYDAIGKIKTFISGGTAGSQIEALTVQPSGAVSINNTGAEPAATLLDLSSTNKGLMLPRMTTTQRDLLVGIISGSISSAGTGQTNGTYDVTISGGGSGNGAIIKATVTGGVATAITIYSGGTNFSGTVTGTIASGGTPATFSFTIGTPEGLRIYNLTTHQSEEWNGTAWVH